jgi:hypothetical protein
MNETRKCDSNADGVHARSRIQRIVDKTMNETRKCDSNADGVHARSRIQRIVDKTMNETRKCDSNGDGGPPLIQKPLMKDATGFLP